MSCETLPDIDNGEVDITGTVFDSVATYSCDEDYRLDGDMQRTCLSSGTWSGSEPQCMGMYSNSVKWTKHSILQQLCFKNKSYVQHFTVGVNTREDNHILYICTSLLLSNLA